MPEPEGGLWRPLEEGGWLGYVRQVAEWAGGEAAGAGEGLPGLPAALAGVGGGTVLVCAPHPDDEAICGLLPLRLLREKKSRVVALAMTLGSDPARRPARWREFRISCQLLGFEPQKFAPSGTAGDEWLLSRHTARTRPHAWQAMQARLLALFAKWRPCLVLLPHGGDAHPTHVGVARLGRQVLRQWSSQGHVIVAAETEGWAPMRRPNCVVAGGVAEVALLCGALACHAGEVQRFPYHRRQPVRMLETAWRTAELVGGFGGAAPPFAFAEAYRVGCWRNGRWRPLAC
ncbi:MAG TPA: PIG-L family deacetylase [Desulfobacterales bacterium]|nr:PIG-L family deacetylase [Desulfobacterales bacterium]